jgi:outer membrane protein
LRAAPLSVVLAPALLLATAAAAEPANTVSLGEVVTAFFAHNTELKLAAADAELARAVLLTAGEPFDAVLAATLSGAQEQSFAEATDRGQEVHTLQLGVGLSKRLRAGVVLAPEVTTSRTRMEGDPTLNVAATSAQLRLLIPLLRDRSGVLTEGPEDAARRFHAASLAEARHAAALGLLRAATAYWDYLTAGRRLEVLASSEARAERTAQETGALVKADERTRTDQIQAQGHLAARRASRIAAEQELIAAWEILAAVTGVTRNDVATVPSAATDFPAPGQQPSADSLGRWQDAGRAGRDDLQAARWRLAGADRARAAASNELVPRLDLEMSGGYQSRERDRAWNRLAPFYGQAPGAQAQVSLRFELPVVRSGPRGRIGQADAAHERQRLLHRHVERSITNGVAVATETVRRSQLALRESELAVDLLGQTVDNERQKFRLGFSTLFAVIQAEEQLTSTLLARIAGQRSFAVALARLRYETGTLLAATSAGETPPGSGALASSLLVLP